MYVLYENLELKILSINIEGGDYILFFKKRQAQYIVLQTEKGFHPTEVDPFFPGVRYCLFRQTKSKLLNCTLMI